MTIGKARNDRIGMLGRVMLAATVINCGMATCHAGDDPASGAPVNERARACGALKYGVELDVLPYAMQGYYGSAFIGRDGWRARAVAARSMVPSFMVRDGFRDKRTDAYAILIDRFFGAKRNQLEGLWIGGGGEYWHSRIRTDDASAFAHYDNFVLTAGSGYVWKLSRHLYLNPWAGLHYVAGGERRIAVSSKMYDQPAVTVEASAKLGLVF